MRLRRFHFFAGHLSIHQDRLAVQRQAAVAQRNVDVAGRVVGAAQLGVGAGGKQHVLVEGEGVHADLFLRIGDRHVVPVGMLVQAPADVRDGIGLVVEAGHVVAHQIGFEAVALYRHHLALGDAQRHRVLHVLAEGADDVAAVYHHGAVDAVVVALREEEAGRPVVPAAGLVGVAVFGDDRVFAELVGDVGAGL